jgi:hypothetical protein
VSGSITQKKETQDIFDRVWGRLLLTGRIKEMAHRIKDRQIRPHKWIVKEMGN